MLQRIQTVYLLIVAALMASLLFLPLSVMQSGGIFYTFDVFGLNTMGADKELVSPTWGLFALVLVTIIISLVTIFLFKKRILQIRLTIFNTILLFCFYGVFAFMIYLFKGEMVGLTYTFKMATAFPAVCVVLNYLAIRNIGADEALVRSLDRLR